LHFENLQGWYTAACEKLKNAGYGDIIIRLAEMLEGKK